MSHKKTKMMKQEINSLHKARNELLQLYVDLLKECDELKHRMELMRKGWGESEWLQWVRSECPDADGWFDGAGKCNEVVAKER
jgi:hypothetical protein